MRRVMLCALSSLTLAVAAFAAPTGPGGTIYFSAFDGGSNEMRYYYLDVDKDWNALGNVTLYATVHDDAALEPKLHADGEDGYQNRTPAGFTDIIPNGVTGLQDMGGAYHNARLFQAIYHNDTAYSGTGTRGADYLAINPNGTVTILNDGVYGSVSPNTCSKYAEGIIGRHLTPNGEPWAIMAQDYSKQAVWTGTFTANGMVTGGAAPRLNLGGAPEYSAGYLDRLRSSHANYTVNGTNVSGAILVYMDQMPPTSGGFWGGWMTGYKHTTGTGYTIVKVPGGDTGTSGGLTGGGDNYTQWDVADTDGNGVPDVYFQSTLGKYAHATDKNGDGDWTDGATRAGTGPCSSGSARAATTAPTTSGSTV